MKIHKLLEAPMKKMRDDISAEKIQYRKDVIQFIRDLVDGLKQKGFSSSDFDDDARWFKFRKSNRNHELTVNIDLNHSINGIPNAGFLSTTPVNVEVINPVKGLGRHGRGGSKTVEYSIDKLKTIFNRIDRIWRDFEKVSTKKQEDNHNKYRQGKNLSKKLEGMGFVISEKRKKKDGYQPPHVMASYKGIKFYVNFNGNIDIDGVQFFKTDTMTPDEIKKAIDTIRSAGFI